MLWLGQLNRGMALSWFIIMTGTAVLWLLPSAAVTVPEIVKETPSLPSITVAQPVEAYTHIASPALSLKFAPPSLRIPDLSKQIIYYGKNARPDGLSGEQKLHLGLKVTGGQPEARSVLVAKPFYLAYEKGQDRKPGAYHFSDEPTPLSLTVESDGEQGSFTVSLINAKGEPVLEPAALKNFTLDEQELPKIGRGNWKINGLRVDGSLLARQRGRWFGGDAFINKYGGEEYAPWVGKQRIQFGQADDQYVRYVGEGDFLVWKEVKWHYAKLGEDTKGLPLLSLRKVDERLLRFDLWDGEGKSRITLNMIKSNEMWRFPTGQQMRFAGARTRSLSVLEFDEQRIIVGPFEWLLRTEDGWIKLDTIEEIDAYVEGKLSGELFVCEGVEKAEGSQVFRGRVFSPLRSSMLIVQLGPQTDQTQVVTEEEQEADEQPMEEAPSIPPTQRLGPPTQNEDMTP